MQLICLSVSHHNTPVELRECINLAPQVIENAFINSPVRTAPFEAILELAIVSTCNRLEIYGLVSLAAAVEENPLSVIQPVKAYLRDALDIPIPQVDSYFRQYMGGQAVRHLFQVASGLDSIAIGETQVLGQVSRALDTALQFGSARHVLSSVFRAAIHTGKRVRTETEIGRHPTNISKIGVQLAESKMGRLVDRNILVIGAGKMGEYTIDALQSSGVQQIVLTNRTLNHAIEMAEQMGGRVLAYEHLFDGLVEADLVFTSTAAPVPIIHRDLILQVMQRRKGRSMTIVDLAVPRNTEARVKDIPNVDVVDMDDLQTFAKSAVVSSHQEIARAQDIVEEEVTAYEKLLRIIPFIGELHRKVEDIRQREVEKALRRLSNPTPEVSEQMEQLSRSLVRKVLHEPTMHLRTETNQETLTDYVDLLAKLFDLSENVPDFLKKDNRWEHP